MFYTPRLKLVWVDRLFMPGLFTIIKNKKEHTWEKYLCNYDAKQTVKPQTYAPSEVSEAC